MQKRGLSPGHDVPSAAQLSGLDEVRRAITTRLQDAQARRNAASKEIGRAKAAKDEAAATTLMGEVAALKDELARGAEEERLAATNLQHALEIIPNLPLPDVPAGADEKANLEVRRVGEPGVFAFTNRPKQHFELGEALGLMDFETAAKLSGARFVVLKGMLARLERALAAFMLDLHTAPERNGIGGYTECNPPLLVRDHTAFGTGNLPKAMDDMFQTRLSQAEVVEAVAGAMQQALQRRLDTLPGVTSALEPGAGTSAARSASVAELRTALSAGREDMLTAASQ